MGGAETGFSDPVLTRMVAEDKVPFYKKKTLRLMYLYLFLCCMGVEMTSGFDSTLIGTLQFSPPWNKYFTDGAKDAKGKPTLSPGLLGFVSSCYQLGSILGVPVAPYVNQRFGRRWAIMSGSVIMIIGAIIQGFAQNLGMYIFSRMVLGFGIVFCIIAGSALIGELAHPKERALLTSLFNASYFIGQITAAAISLATSEIANDWGWRIPSLLQACPSLLQVAFVFLLPESPRYLVSKDRDDEAFAVLVKYHAEGDADSLLVKAEMAQIKSTIMIELEHSKSSWLDMIATAGMRRRVFISGFLGLFTQMSGNTLLSYYQNLLYIMMGYTSTYAKTRINLANACWSFATALIAAYVVSRFRRRVMFMLSSGSMLTVFVCITISFERLRAAKDGGYTNKAAGIAALFFYFAYSPCYNIGNNALTYTYLIELFPYAQRTRGIGIEQVFGKIGGFFSQNVNPIALTAIDWKYFAVYSGWIAFEFLFIYFLYPETSGRTLEELAFLFEDKEFAEKAVIAVEKQIHHEDMDEKKVAVVHEEDKGVDRIV
ncbi:MFS general substrate transporter [Glarea lozoyensis ATCC 20868]|uniref:MFS general substrate transporter n=1 Tax=Glarea lozoyensis (strain ATCC 20868 / MF5171) TaxID=1116229 RepID=S3D0I7_GLAL2|nr:MFS general substrate transporter [Glarea lozoyensis ATCC 20868]EPE31360.1 MFS general substrate transporter [Glarea lozoyensis ATCC 20868]